MGVNWPTKSAGEKLNAADWNNARTDFITGKFFDNSGAGSQYVQASHNGTDSLISSSAGKLRLNAPNGSTLTLEINSTPIGTISSSLFTLAQALKVPDGSVSTPGVHFSGDTDTGIALIGSALALVFGGASKVTLDTNSLNLANGVDLEMAGNALIKASSSTANLTLDTADATTGQVFKSGGVTTATIGPTYITAVNGVKFKASGTGSDALTHYEESGTWTPAITFQTPGTFSTTYNTQYGTYKRIGKLVHCWGRMAVNVWSLGTASGNFLVTGLPYASNNVGGTSNEQWIGSASSSSINFGSYDLWSVVPYITQSSSQIQFFMNSISGDVNVVATSTATFNSPSALDLRIYIAYETA